MTPNQVFSIANGVALLAWLSLAALPRQRWVADIVTRLVVPLLFAGLYCAIIATEWRGSAGGFQTLPAVATLFSQPWLLLAGWVHYLAFDLIVGSSEVQDAREHGIPHLLVLPCLALTFMFGPAGWLAYVVLRAAHQRAAGAPR